MGSLFQSEIAPVEAMPEAGTVHLRGRVTFDEVPEVRKVLIDAIGQHTGSKLVLELAGVKEIDTSGAAVVAEALKLGINRGLRVLLCSPSDPVMQIFRLAGFEDVLDHCCVDPQETWRRLQN